MPNCHLVTAYAELRMLSEHEGEGEAVNCGAYVVSVRYTYLRLIAILNLWYGYVSRAAGAVVEPRGCANLA
jgi:hypothetical protein